MLLGVTVLAVLTAPWLTPLYAGTGWTPRQIEVLTQFAYLCLPQIFFYGMYALYSQVLNTRGHFAAPMFAPIVNNVVVIVGCVVFLVVEHSPDIDDIDTGGILLLGHRSPPSASSRRPRCWCRCCRAPATASGRASTCVARAWAGR